MSGGPSHHHPGISRRPFRRERRSGTSATLPGSVREQLAALEAAVAGLTEAATEPSLGEVADRLEKQVSRIGKEQFKVNTLIEAQQKNHEAMLEQLREAGAHRERELAQLREKLSEATSLGQVGVVQRLLPALDGVEEALASGRRLMQRSEARDKAAAHPSLWQRINPARRVGPPAETSDSRAMASWLEGLSLVHERLMEALASADVVPIPTEGRPFDPHVHVAVETVPAAGQVQPGTIVREHRRGYVHGNAVLRYAEVVVARASMESTQ